MFTLKKRITTATILLILFCVSTNDAWSQYTRETDSLTLVDLYNSCNGTNWNNNSGWLEEGVLINDWYGVTVNEGRVTRLNLSSNNVSNSLPNLNGLNNLYSLNLSYNYLTFEDLYSSGITSSDIQYLTLGYQKTRLKISGETDNNGLTRLHCPVEGSQYHFTWYKGVDEIASGISNSIEIYAEFNERYFVDVSCEDYDGLIIQGYGNGFLSPAEIKDSLALVDFYYATGGSNWLNNSGWLQSGVRYSEWNGIYKYNERVKWIHLNDNGLRGYIPNCIGQIDSLESILLRDNNLSGNLPFELSKLEKLETLYINGNNFNFENIAASGIKDNDIDHFSYSSQKAIPLNFNYDSIAQKLKVSVDLNNSNNTYRWANSDFSIYIEDTVDNYIECDPVFTQIYMVRVFNEDYPRLMLSGDEEYITPYKDKYKEALIAIYNSCGGKNWINKTNWCTNEDISTWYGVSVIRDGVTKLELSDNGLIGKIPLEIENLKSVRDVDFSKNRIGSDIPELSQLPILYNLKIYENNFTFRNIIASGLKPDDLQYFSYNPQNDIPFNRNENLNNDSVTLSIEDSHPNDIYRWYVTGDNYYPEEQEGESTSSFTFNPDRTLTYYTRITNSIYPALQINSEEMEVVTPYTENDKQALIAIFDSCGGEEWVNNTNWKTDADISTWYGVNSYGGRVSHIGLSDNGLVGELPDNINDLTMLRSIFLWGNNLEGRIPIVVDPQNNYPITSVHIGNNKYSFNDLVESGLIDENLSSFSYVPQKSQPKPELTIQYPNVKLTVPPCEGCSYKWQADGTEINDVNGDPSGIHGNEYIYTPKNAQEINVIMSHDKYTGNKNDHERYTTIPTERVIVEPFIPIVIEVIDKTDASFVNGDDGSLTFKVSGGSGAGIMYSLDQDNWLEYNSESTLSNLAKGEYQLWVKDSYGALESISFRIYSFQIKTISSICDQSGTIKILGVDPDKEYEYLLYQGEKIYNEIKIGDQIWMQKNLDIDDGGEGIYLSEDNTYGRLYDWNAANRIANIIDGWHLPSQIEFKTLSDYLGGADIAGGKIKERGFNHWISPNAGATNESNFKALPGGYYDTTHVEIGRYGQWWSSSKSSTDRASCWRCSYDSETFYQSYRQLTIGLSVRLVKDEDNPLSWERYNDSIVGLESGDYYVQIREKDSFYSSNKMPVEIYLVEKPIAEITTNIEDNVIQEGSSVTLTANDADSYLWSTGATTQSIEVSPALTSNYSLVIGNEGCYSEQIDTTIHVIIDVEVEVSSVCGEKNGTLMVSGMEEGLEYEYQLYKDGEIINPGMGSVNIEGEDYETLTFGKQTWLNRNLSFDDGLVGISSYNDNYKDVYGLYYDWDAAMRIASKVEGWRMPTNDDWLDLINFLSADSKYYCGGDSEHIAKALASTDQWLYYNRDCAVGKDISKNNSSGFNASANGYAYGTYGGSFYGLRTEAHWWTGSEVSQSSAIDINLHYAFEYALLNGTRTKRGTYLGVRLVRDENYIWIDFDRTINDLEPGDYTIKFREKESQSVTETYSFTVLDHLYPNLQINNPDPINFNDSSCNLTDTTVIEGSDPNLVFSYWEDELASIPLSSPESISKQGTYFIKATTEAGCETIKPVVLCSDISFEVSRVISCDETTGAVEILGLDNNKEHEYSLVPRKNIIKDFEEVVIGDQVWMAKNLEIDDGGAGVYSYRLNESYVSIYGRLYTWDAAVRVASEIDGWHLPYASEWDILVSYLGGTDVAGRKMKEVGTIHWASPNGDGSYYATNSSGFTALPGGMGAPNGRGGWNWSGIGSYAGFRTADPPENHYGNTVGLRNNLPRCSVGKGGLDYQLFSVRLLKDAPIQYDWKNYEGRIDGLQEGNYSIVFREKDNDPYCISEELYFNISIDEPQQIFAYSNNISYYGAANGRVVISKINGGAVGEKSINFNDDPYHQYTFNGSHINISDLSKGEYFIVSTDINGCASDTTIITIAEPQSFSFHAYVAQNETVPLSKNGIVVIDYLEAAPYLDYEYTIDEGQTWHPVVQGDSIKNLPADSLYITMRTGEIFSDTQGLYIEQICDQLDINAVQTSYCNNATSFQLEGLDSNKDYEYHINYKGNGKTDLIFSTSATHINFYYSASNWEQSLEFDLGDGNISSGSISEGGFEVLHQYTDGKSKHTISVNAEDLTSLIIYSDIEIFEIIVPTEIENLSYLRIRNNPLNTNQLDRLLDNLVETGIEGGSLDIRFNSEQASNIEAITTLQSRSWNVSYISMYTSALFDIGEGSSNENNQSKDLDVMKDLPISNGLNDEDLSEYWVNYNGSIDNLESGLYSIEVREVGYICSFENEFEIIENPPVELITNNINEDEINFKPSIDSIYGGSGESFSYSLDYSPTWYNYNGVPIILEELEYGENIIIARDGVGCTSEPDTINYSQPQTFTFTAHVAKHETNAGAADGVIVIDSIYAAQTLSFEYTKDNRATWVSIEQGDSIIGLTTGDYTLILRAGVVESEPETFTIEQTCSSYVVTVNDSTKCGDTKGTITINGLDPDKEYQYLLIPKGQGGKPTITLLGDNPLTWTLGETFVDPGATAYDAKDGDITESIVVTDNIDVNTEGTYQVAYNVTDSDGNSAEEVVREVIVEENSFNPEEVTIGTQTWMAVNLDVDDGGEGIYVYGGNEDNPDYDYNLATYGRLYTWEAAKRVAASINGWHLPGNAEWTTLVTYVGAANAGSKLAGNESLWADGGLKQSTAFGSSGFNGLPGGYLYDRDDTFRGVGRSSIWWSATGNGNFYAWVHGLSCELSVLSSRDFMGQKTGSSVRLIKDYSHTPTITLLGDSSITINVGDTYTDAGATAYDTRYGDITSDIVVVNNVNTSVAGAYTVTYNVTTEDGNAAEEVIREVVVEEINTIWGTEIVEVTNPITGRTWMDRNIGATRAATSSTDEEAYGHLFQWGRNPDGHELRTSGTTATLSSTDIPGHGDFILAPNEPYDWRNPQNDNLWQDIIQDGWRLPTEQEWLDEIDTWSSEDYNGAYSSVLKLPMTGFRYSINGSLPNVGLAGYYWSSTVSGMYAKRLTFTNVSARIYSLYRTSGSSVRLIKDQP